MQVLSRAALAAHDTQGPGPGVPGLTGRPVLPPLEMCRTLECSVPGPQVRTRPRQLDVGTVHGYPGSREARVMPGATCNQTRDQAQSHIYMEVDPLYSSFAPGPLYLEAGQTLAGGLVSSTSSQTSSGYSTAPSDTQRLSGLGGGLYECGEAEYEAAQDSRGTRGFNINSISQACEFHQTQRNSQRQKKPELVMNNILLQQTNREIL